MLYISYGTWYTLLDCFSVTFLPSKNYISVNAFKPYSLAHHYNITASLDKFSGKYCPAFIYKPSSTLNHIILRMAGFLLKSQGNSNW